MKKFLATSFIMILFAAGMTAGAQVNRNDELTGLPGDNLNLYAVMKLFQESQTLEEFERKLNDKNSGINNLDLNGDHLVDYITVNDYVDGDIHHIVLRVAVNQNESQDVAVFNVQKFSDGSVQVQLVGDEALYGKNYIIEPNYADNNNNGGTYNNNNGETYNPGYSGGNPDYYERGPVVSDALNISLWPLVRLLFLPGYIVWNSIFGWDNYPDYWSPWRPWDVDYYCGFHSYWNPFYFGHYRRWDELRCADYHDFYYGGLRAHSPMVNNRIMEGRFRGNSNPGMRREGMMAARMNSGRMGGMRNEGSMSGNGRNSGFSQRSMGNMSSGSAGNNNFRNNFSAGRSAGTYSGRMSSSPSAYRNSDFSQRSMGNISSRSARNSGYQNNFSSRRSAGIISGRNSSSSYAYNRSSGFSQRSMGNMSARSARSNSYQSRGFSGRSGSLFSSRSYSGGQSGSSLKSARMSSGRSGGSFRSSGSGGRSSGGGNRGGGGHSGGRNRR